MIISHKLKFLYIHIPKNWGSSIYDSFKKVDADIVDLHMPEEGNKVDKTHMLPMHHSQYDVVQSAINDGYKVFSTIRDPKERFYSSLRYAQKHLNYQDHNFFHYSYLSSIRNKGYTQNCRFIHGCPQYEFIFRDNKKITHKDFICDENLFENLSDYFGVKLEGSHKNKSDKSNNIKIDFEDFIDIYSKDLELYKNTKEQ